MSALILGKGSCIGAIMDILLGSGFDAVHFQNGSSVGELDLNEYGELDMLILMKEAVKEGDIKKIWKEAAGLDVPVVLW